MHGLDSTTHVVLIPYCCPCRWLQPDRAVDAEASELGLPAEPPLTGLPAEFTVTTRDQDGKMVYVADMKVHCVYTVHVYKCASCIYMYMYMYDVYTMSSMCSVPFHDLV